MPGLSQAGMEQGDNRASISLLFYRPSKYSLLDRLESPKKERWGLIWDSRVYKICFLKSQKNHPIIESSVCSRDFLESGTVSLSTPETAPQLPTPSCMALVKNTQPTRKRDPGVGLTTVWTVSLSTQNGRNPASQGLGEVHRQRIYDLLCNGFVALIKN